MFPAFLAVSHLSVYCSDSLSTVPTCVLLQVDLEPLTFQLTSMPFAVVHLFPSRGSNVSLFRFGCLYHIALPSKHFATVLARNTN